MIVLWAQKYMSKTTLFLNLGVVCIENWFWILVSGTESEIFQTPQMPRTISNCAIGKLKKDRKKHTAIKIFSVLGNTSQWWSLCKQSFNFWGQSPSRLTQVKKTCLGTFHISPIDEVAIQRKHFILGDLHTLGNPIFRNIPTRLPWQSVISAQSIWSLTQPLQSGC